MLLPMPCHAHHGKGFDGMAWLGMAENMGWTWAGMTWHGLGWSWDGMAWDGHGIAWHAMATKTRD